MFVDMYISSFIYLQSVLEYAIHAFLHIIIDTSKFCKQKQIMNLELICSLYAKIKLFKFLD